MRIVTAVLSGLYLLFLWLSAGAASIPPERAARVGVEFLRAKGVAVQGTRGAQGPLALAAVGDAQGVMTVVEAGQRLRGGEGSSWYLFNTPEGQPAAFVLVRGDDEEGESVLGYSLTERFDVQAAPAHVRAWFEVYSQGALIRGERPLRGEGAVTPLLGGIQWDQMEPYNLFTPAWDDGQPTAVGCVATAMGQIMRYHQWPRKAASRLIEYTPRGMSLMLRQWLGVHEYRWESMPAKLTKESPREYQESVARLLYEAGLAVGMNYNVPDGGGSGAFTYRAAQELLATFDYAPSMIFTKRNFYSRQEWERLILEELKARRPVLYGGLGVQGGHTFVCDGYDGEGRFHFNWGWSGMCDGYFSLSSLAPQSLGTGGGAGGFTNAQEIAARIEPKRPGVHYELSPIFVLDYLKPEAKMKNGQLEVAKDKPVQLQIGKFFSHCPQRNLNVEFALGIYTSGGECISVQRISGLADVDIYHGVSDREFKAQGVKIEADFGGVANGTYTVKFIYRLMEKGATQSTGAWLEAVTHRGERKILTAEVKDDGVILRNAPFSKVALKVEQLETECPADTPVRLHLRVTNEGQIEYSSLFAVAESADYFASTIRHSNTLFLEPGESKELSFTVKLSDGYNADGKGDLAFGWDPDNGARLPEVDWAEVSCHTPLVYTLQAQLPVGATELSGTIALEKRELAQQEILAFKLTLQNANAGAYFADQLLYRIRRDGKTIHGPSVLAPYLRIAPSGQHEGDYTHEMPYTIPGDYTLEVGLYAKDQEAKMLVLSGATVTFTVLKGNFDDQLPAKPEQPTQSEHFTPVVASGMPSLQVSPNPFAESLSVGNEGASGALQEAELLDMRGRILITGRFDGRAFVRLDTRSLPSGSYILRVRGERECVTRMVVKR